MGDTGAEGEMEDSPATAMLCRSPTSGPAMEREVRGSDGCVGR
jgi:hypothetical protein